MYYNTNINDTQDVEIKFDRTNQNRIMKAIEKKTSQNYFTEEELNQIKDTFKKLEVIDFNLEAFIDTVDLSDDVIDEAYGDIHKCGTYNDGYNDGINHILNYKKEVQYKYGLLLQKLEHLCFNYGKQEQLTKDELLTIRDLLHYEYTEGAI